jgi:hypothetical protein
MSSHENTAAVALEALIEMHRGRFWPWLDLDCHVTKWHEIETEDGTWPALMVDGGTVMFATHDGVDLHVCGPITDDTVATYVIEPDGHYYLANISEDPFAAHEEAAAEGRN